MKEKCIRTFRHSLPQLLEPSEFFFCEWVQLQDRKGIAEGEKRKVVVVGGDGGGGFSKEIFPEIKDKKKKAGVSKKEECGVEIKTAAQW